MGIGMQVARLSAGIEDDLSHEAPPQQCRPVIGPGQPGPVIDQGIVAGGKGVMEDDRDILPCQPAQLINIAERIEERG